MDLFGNPNLLPLDGELLLYEKFLNKAEADLLFETLIVKTDWKQEGMRIFGKELPFPRLTAWYADEGKSYTYSGLLNTPLAFSKDIWDLKEKIEKKSGFVFNSALLNYYRHGSDSMGWHADDEPELGLNPVIASISLGASRKFQFKHKKNKELKTAVVLQHGSLLMMQGQIQHHWLHQIPKVAHSGPRINITFRNIL
jgi:alkylated DNA repair dioxygenase AlkB